MLSRDYYIIENTLFLFLQHGYIICIFINSIIKTIGICTYNNRYNLFLWHQLQSIIFDSGEISIGIILYKNKLLQSYWCYAGMQLLQVYHSDLWRTRAQIRCIRVRTNNLSPWLKPFVKCFFIQLIMLYPICCSCNKLYNVRVYFTIFAPKIFHSLKRKQKLYSIIKYKERR